MLEKIIYEILDLTYPKMDTTDLPNILFKLNSTKELIYLGDFTPYDIDIVIEQINHKRKYLLKEIKKDAKKLGLSDEDIFELECYIEEAITYEEFKSEYKKYKKNKDNKTINRFKITLEIKKEALNYATNKINSKEKKFDLTLKEKDRYEEKYIKEYISKAKTIFKENQDTFLKNKTTFANNFIKKYSNDLDGYKRYIRFDNITTLLKKYYNFFIPTLYTKRHTYISGMTGSGKSELLKLLIYSDILKRLKNQKLSTVLIEPHGDLSQEVASFTENYKNEDLIYICPNLKENYTVTINPFEMEKETKTEQNIDILASELIEVFKMILDSSFSIPMESILLPCITTILYLNDPSKNNFAGIEELQRMMDDNHNKDLIEFAILNLPNPNHKSFFRNGFKNKSLAVTKQAIYSKLQSLLNSNIFSKLVQGRSTINLEQELNSGKLIVINLSKGLMGDASSKFFGALIIALINHIVLKRVNQSKNIRVPINLIIDESQNYITPSIETALTELRKYGLHLTLVSQIVGQNSNTQLEKILLSNTAIKIVGMNATDSLDKLGKEIQVPTQELQKLTIGEFYIKLGSKDAIKFKTSDMLLGDNNKITTSQFNETKLEQLQKYYKNIKKVEKQTIKTDDKIVTKNIETSNSNIQTLSKPKFKLPPKG